jgi:hypothetical protein
MTELLKAEALPPYPSSATAERRPTKGYHREWKRPPLNTDPPLTTQVPRLYHRRQPLLLQSSTVRLSSSTTSIHKNPEISLTPTTGRRHRHSSIPRRLDSVERLSTPIIPKQAKNPDPPHRSGLRDKSTEVNTHPLPKTNMDRNRLGLPKIPRQPPYRFQGTVPERNRDETQDQILIQKTMGKADRPSSLHLPGPTPGETIVSSPSPTAAVQGTNQGLLLAHTRNPSHLPKGVAQVGRHKPISPFPSPPSLLTLWTDASLFWGGEPTLQTGGKQADNGAGRNPPST